MALAAALTIAGSDSGGGAGIQADLKTFSALGVYGASAITALTAQNTQGVQGIYEVAPQFVGKQIESVAADISLAACKLGMLANRAIVEEVARAVDKWALRPLVVDPVMVAQSGDRLLAPDAVAAIKQLLLPQASIITPNLPEAAVLLETSEREILADPWAAVEALLNLGPGAVLLKGGHAAELGTDAGQVKTHAAAQDGKPADRNGARQVADTSVVTDYLMISKTNKMNNKQNIIEQEKFAKELIPTANTHGSGCTLAAAITAYLARGLDLPASSRKAEHFIDEAIRAAATLGLGKGSGPVHHLHNLT